MWGKRGQIAIEYVVISAVAITLAMGGWFVVQDSLAKYTDQLELDKLETTVQQFTTSSEEVAYLGEGAKKTVEVIMPERMNYMQVIEEDGVYYLQVSINTSAGEQRLLYELPGAVQATTCELG